MEILLSWLVLAFAFWLTAVILPAMKVRSVGSTLIIAAIFGVLNFFLGWLFYFVFGIATLGLAWLFSFITRWIVNAIILKITDAMTDRLTIDGFGWTLVAAALISGIGTVAEGLIRLAF